MLALWGWLTGRLLLRWLLVCAFKVVLRLPMTDLPEAAHL